VQDKVYKIKYLPRFEKDLEEITDYITFELYSTDSAINLVNRIEKAILERQSCPLSFEPFQSTRKRKHPYYRIYVNNFTVYYVIINDVMEVRRVLYKGRNVHKIIK